MYKYRSLLLWGIAAALVVAAFSEPALAQCAMCKQSVANSTNGAAAGLNLAIVVLLIPPLALFAGIFGAFYRYRNVQGNGYERDGAPIHADRES